MSGAGWADLEAWLGRHAELEARWEALWVAAPEVDPAGFRAGTASLDAALRLHLEQEEAFLLPAWERLPDPPPNATAAVLRRDHDLLRGLLASLAGATARVERADLLWRLREVLHHHDRREAASIKPGLDRALPLELRRTWLERFAAEEAALPPAWTFALAGRTEADGPGPEEAVAADAPVLPTLATLGVPAHPKGPRLRARVEALAAEVDRLPGARERRLRGAELWGELRRLRIAGRPAFGPRPAAPTDTG